MKFLIATSSLILVFCCGISFSGNVKEKGPRVVTPLGTIEGSYETSSGGKPYESYVGIRYAQPITKEQRFQAPKPAKPWTGVFYAQNWSPWCMQYVLDPSNSGIPKVTGSEDCLYLNVFTPAAKYRSKTKTSPTGLLPVIIFFQGGSFQFGSASNYRADYLLNELVVLVTLDYRLGALGFLSTENEIVSGNMGLKDQVMAMHWVKNNIRYFNGDPERITIFGDGAGAVSVHLHYMSKLTKGLFQKGMSMSGTALTCWAMSEGNLDKAKKLATILRCPSGDTRKMVDCLKTRSAEDITRASVKLTAWIVSPPAPFGPVVEYGNSDSKFLHQQPIDSLITGEVHKLPWSTSVVSEEGLSPAALILANATLMKQLNDDWERIAPNLLDYIYTIPQSDQKKVSQLVRKHYFGTSPIDKSKAKQIIRMIGDRWYYSEAEKAAKLHARASRSSVRVYYFSYKGAQSSADAFLGNKVNYGVMHLDDLVYILRSYTNPTTTQRDRDMQKLMINLWVSYARDRVPRVIFDWPALDGDEENFSFLHIAAPDNVYMDESRNFGDKDFWHSIPFRENIVAQKRGR